MSIDTDQASEQSLLDRMSAHFAPPEKSTPESEPAADTAPEPTESASVEAESTDADQPQQESDDGMVDFEWNGKAFRVPPELAELKEQAMLKADYTRKTQELADLRRHATIIADQQKQAIEFQKATSAEQQQLAQLNATLDQYKKVDWPNLDLETTVRYQTQLSQLREQKQDLERNLGQKQQELQQTLNQKRAEMTRTAYDFISKHVPGFGPDSEVEKSVAKYVDGAGLPIDAFVNGALSYPAVGVLAWKAMQYDQLKAGKAAAVKAVQKAPPVVKPGSVTGTNAANGKQLQDLRAQFKRSGDFRDAARLLVAAKKLKG